MRNILRLLTLCISLGCPPLFSGQSALVHPPGRFVIVHGARLWVEIEGSGSPVILLPGGPGESHDGFHPVFSALAKTHTVIYYDQFGRGRSDRAKNKDEYTLERDVSDLEDLRKALGFGKIDILGPSYGGVQAQAYAIRYPEAVRKLVLSDTLYSTAMLQANDDSNSYEISHQYPEVWDKLQALHAKGFNSCSKEYTEAASQVALLGLLYFHDVSNIAKIEGKGDFSQEVYCAMLGDDADVHIGGPLAHFDFRADLSRLKMPILILQGRFDRVSIPRWSIKYKKYAPQATFVMFENSGHIPFYEEEEKALQTILKFLDTPSLSPNP